MSFAYLIAFGFGYFVKDGELSWTTPFIDPFILIFVSILVIPMPFKTVKQALADILLVTPS